MFGDSREIFEQKLALERAYDVQDNKFDEVKRQANLESQKRSYQFPAVEPVEPGRRAIRFDSFLGERH